MGVFENDFILNESFFPKILLYKLFVDIFMITKATPTEMLMFLYYLKKNCFSGSSRDMVKCTYATALRSFI